MDTDPLVSLAPYEKTQGSGEIKSHRIAVAPHGDEPVEEMKEILPNADKVELSSKIDFSDTLMTYHLTHDKNLNEYILMANQAAHVKENALSISAGENTLVSEKNSIYQTSGCDIRA